MKTKLKTKNAPGAVIMAGASSIWKFVEKNAAGFCLPTVDHLMQILDLMRPPAPARGPRLVCPPALSGRLVGVCSVRGSYQ